VRLLIVILIVFFFYSCATYPSPKIEDGLYLNYKYGFCLELPKNWSVSKKLKTIIPGWTLSEEPPEWLKHNFTDQQLKSLQLICWDSKLLAFIIAFASNDNKDLNKPDNFKDPYAEWKGFINEKDVKMKAESQSFVYNCHGDRTCALEFWFVSDSTVFDYNYKVYKKIVDSFTILNE